MNQHYTWILEIVKQVPAMFVLALVVFMFLRAGDANTALLKQVADANTNSITEALDSFGDRVSEMASEMLATHDECHVIQKHSIKALEQDAAARREQTKVMERLAAEIRRRMPGN
ncbi:MAG: hypothetical protein V3R16_02460 [Nitrospirales bacterium]